jgi:hypothetical protein
MLQDYIQILKCFDKGNQFYWLDKLHIPNSVKGYLILYFNL